uniref:Uncharacterized protein n=1 Tax=Strongyloides venezuelensis TaxID=75913 RepID=A0A0K0FSA2_STRVS
MIIHILYSYTDGIFHYLYIQTSDVPKFTLLLREIILWFRCFSCPLFLYLIILKEPLVYYLNCFKHIKKYKTKPQEIQLRNFGEVYFIQLKNQWGDLRQGIDDEKK